MYKQYKDTITGQTVTQAIIRTIDNTCIPFDPDNTDYQAYLKWVEAGNTPEPADEQGA
jgi:hypothetical protein